MQEESNISSTLQEIPATGTQGEVSSLQLPPENKKKKRKASPYKRKTLSKFKGAPRTLDLPDRAEAWERFVLGADVFTLAKHFQTNIEQIGIAIQSVAQELGYPYTHIDPEFERFRLLEGADRVKTSLVKLLSESYKILKEIDSAREITKTELNLADLDKKDAADYFSFVESRQNEIKAITALLDQYHKVNSSIAELAGIKRTKPIRKAKQVQSQEDLLENLSDEELIEIQAKADGD